MAKSGYYLSHIVLITFLIILTVRELKWPKISTLEVVCLLFFFLINSALLVFLGNSFNSGIDDVLLRILFYTNGFLILLLVMSAFFYSGHFANDVSAFFFIAVMALTLSDLLLFGIYFTDLVELKYIDNVFYIPGLYFLLKSYLKHRKLKTTKRAEENQAQVVRTGRKDLILSGV